MELYYPPRPKSKIEEYNLRLKERELYTNNILDRFTNNGNGSPLKDEKGNLITKRKAILERSKDLDNNFPQSQQVNPYDRQNIQLNYSNNINDNNHFNNYTEQNYDNDNNNELELEQNQPNNINSVNNVNNNIINNTKIKAKQNEESKNSNNNIIENEDNYQGIGIIPRVSDFQKIKQRMKFDSLQDDLAKAIEEKKIKAEKEKQKKLEEDLKEELKVRKAIEEEQRLIKLEKKKKEEEENKLRMLNLQKSEKEKKKKNLIDIDEYYGKDFRTFQKNKKVNNINNTNKSNVTTDLNNNYTSNTNNEYNEFENMDNIPNNLRINSEQNINQTKLDTLQAINNFTINVYKNRHILENDISKLKREVRDQYLEMNELFNKLKDTSDQAEFSKNSLLKESKLLKEQLLQSKIINTLNKNIIKRNYDQNMNINADEFEGKTDDINPNLISKNSNLPGTSDFIYFRDDNNNISSLAQAGKNIIELKGEGEMIPIEEENQEGNEKVKEFNKNNILYKMNDEEYIRKKQFYEDMHKECKMEDLYKELEDIENLNKKLTPMNKIHTLKSNFTVDYDRLLTKEKKIKEKFKNKI